MRFDIKNRNEPSRIYIAKVDRIPLYCINFGIDEDSFTVTKNLNNTSQLSFTIYKEINGSMVEGYDLINEFMLLYVTDCGWFKIINTPEVSYDGFKESKAVAAESVEIELQGYDIIGIDINTAQSNSLEMLIDKNIDEDTKLPKRSISFYNKDDKNFSLLDYIVDEYIPWWHIEHVDRTLTDDNLTSESSRHVMYFSIDNQDLYSFLTQTLADAFQCIFVFNNETYGISVYDPRLFGQDTNIYFGYRNVQDAINITVDTDNLFTTFNVTGGEGLDNIYFVNYGTNTIENIDYYLNTKYLSSVIIDHYKSWQSFYNNNRSKYSDLSTSYNKYLKQSTEIQNRLPNDGCETNWGDFGKEDLLISHNDYESQIKAYEKIYEVNGFFDIDSLKKNPAEYADYISIKETILPNIDIAIENLELTQDKKKDYLTNYETDWDLYGLDELNSKIKVYKNTIDIYSEFKDDYESSNFTYSKEFYISKHNYYLEQVSYYNDCLNALSDRKDELEKVNLQLNTIDTQRQNLIASVDKSKFMTKDEIFAIRKLYRNTNYQNENIFITPLDSQTDIINKQDQLFHIATDALFAASQPQYNFSMTAENILALSEYETEIKNLELGNFIHIDIDDGLYVKLRISSITYNPLLFTNNFSLGFTNMIKYSSKRDDFVSLLSRNSTNSKKSVNSNMTENSDIQKSQISVNLLQKIINNPYFKNNVNSYTATGISNFKTDFDNVITRYIKTENLESIIANIHELKADSSFITYLENMFLTSESLLANTAYIDSLQTKFAKIDLSNITDTVISGAIIKENTIETTHIRKGAITNAKITSVDAGKIKTGTIDTSLITIGNNNKNLLINNSTIQINDGNQIRVQIGQDKQDDYNIYVLDKAGKLMFDATGIHSLGIKSPIIVDNMISNDAAISGEKINLHSLISRIEDSTETLTTNSITYNGKTLDVQFDSITSKVGELNNTYSKITQNINTIKSTTGSFITSKGFTSKLGDYSTIEYTTTAVNQSKTGIQTELTEILTTYPTTALVNKKFDNYSTTLNTKTLIQNANDSILAKISGDYVVSTTYSNENTARKTQLEKTLKSYYSNVDVDTKFTNTIDGIQTDLSGKYITSLDFSKKTNAINGKIDTVSDNVNDKNTYSILSIDILYNPTTQNQTAPTGYKNSPLTNGWVISCPNIKSDQYLWTVMRINYTNDVITYTDPVCITGHDGINGKTGKDGRGIKIIKTEYAIGDSKSTYPSIGWSSNFNDVFSKWQNGKYIWIRQLITYNDNSQEYGNYQCDTNSIFIDKSIIGGQNIYTASDRDLLNKWKYSLPLDDTFKITSNKVDNNFINNGIYNEQIYTIFYQLPWGKYAHVYREHSLTTGKRYTFSFSLKVTKATKVNLRSLMAFATDEEPNSSSQVNGITWSSKWVDISSEGLERRYSFSFIAFETTYIGFTLNHNVIGNDPCELEISKLQLEVGEYATEFHLNVNDIYNSTERSIHDLMNNHLNGYYSTFDFHDKINIKNNEIKSTIESNYYSKADWETVSKGANKWLIYHYFYENNDDHLVDLNYFTNLVPDKIYTQSARNIQFGEEPISTDDKQSCLYKLSTNVHFTQDQTWETEITVDTYGILYVNGACIFKDKSFEFKRPVTLSFHKGWNSIVFYVRVYTRWLYYFVELRESLINVPNCDMINCYAPFVNEFNSSFAQTASLLQSTVKNYVDKTEVISSINQSAESIKISADKIDTKSIVSLTQLKDKSSQTFINGRNFITGTIEAKQLNVKDFNTLHATIAEWDIGQDCLEKYVVDPNDSKQYYHSFYRRLDSIDMNTNLLGVEYGHFESTNSGTKKFVIDNINFNMSANGEITLGEHNFDNKVASGLINNTKIFFTQTTYNNEHTQVISEGQLLVSPFGGYSRFIDNNSSEFFGIYANTDCFSLSDGKANNAYFVLPTKMGNACVQFPHNTIWAANGIYLADQHLSDAIDDYTQEWVDKDGVTQRVTNDHDNPLLPSSPVSKYGLTPQLIWEDDDLNLHINFDDWMMLNAQAYHQDHPIIFNGQCFGCDNSFNNTSNTDFAHDNQRFRNGFFYKVYAQGGFQSTSDRKKKMNFSELDSSWVKEFIMNLNPQLFNYKTDTEHEQKFMHMGFIAQDVHDLANNLNKKLTIYSAFVYDTPPIIDTKGLTTATSNEYYNPKADSKTLYNDEDDIDDKFLNWSLDYIEFIAPLTKFAQDHQKELKNQQQIIDNQDSLINNLLIQITALETTIAKEE